MSSHAFEKLSLDEKKVNTKTSTDDLLFYCSAEYCEGLLLDIDYKEIEGQVECPICYNSINSGKVTRLIKCDHLFCFKCINDWDAGYVASFLYCFN